MLAGVDDPICVSSIEKGVLTVLHKEIQGDKVSRVVFEPRWRRIVVPRLSLALGRFTSLF